MNKKQYEGGVFRAIRSAKGARLVLVPNKRMLMSAVLARLIEYIVVDFDSLPSLIDDVSCELDWSDLPDSKRSTIEGEAAAAFNKILHPGVK